MSEQPQQPLTQRGVGLGVAIGAGVGTALGTLCIGGDQSAAPVIERVNR